MIDEIQTTKQIGDNPLIKDYVLLATFIGVAIVSFVKIFYDDSTKKLPLSERLAKTTYGIFGSVLATWLSFELLFAYTPFPLRLDLAIAAVFGYLGAETTIKVAMRLFGKKYGIDLKDLEPQKEEVKIKKEEGETNNG